MALTEEGLIDVPGLMSRYVRLGSGAKAHYVTSGESGPAVVLCHGGLAGSSGTAGFRFMAPFLGANGFRVYCPDLPGFGLTADYEGAYQPDTAGHIDFLHDFTTALCLDRYHLSGNLNVQNFVTAHPERVISFVGITAPVIDLFSAEEIATLMSGGREREDEGAPRFEPYDGTAESMRRLMLAIVDDPAKVTDDLVAMRTNAANLHRDYHLRFLANLMDHSSDTNRSARLNVRGRFDKLTLPGIFLWGKQDRAYPGFAHKQEDALPGMQFFYVDGAGHQSQTDQPDLFNQVFLEFFRDGKVSNETAERAGISTRRASNPNLVEVSAPIGA